MLLLILLGRLSLFLVFLHQLRILCHFFIILLFVDLIEYLEILLLPIFNHLPKITDSLIVRHPPAFLLHETKHNKVKHYPIIFWYPKVDNQVFLLVAHIELLGALLAPLGCRTNLGFLALFGLRGFLLLLWVIRQQLTDSLLKLAKEYPVIIETERRFIVVFI